MTHCKVNIQQHSAAISSVAAIVLLLLALVASVPVAAYNGKLDANPSTVHAANVVHASSTYPKEDCNAPEEALGQPDWKLQTVCDLTDTVADCFSLPYCRILYICEGWVPNFTDENPHIELGFDPLANITHIAISEQGARGWINSVVLKSADGLERIIYEAEDPDEPSELYKKSPKMKADGVYFAPGIDYRGGVSFTMDDEPCLSWDVQSEIPLDGETGLGHHSHCRNPTNHPDGPWCYTYYNDTDGTYLNATCEVPVADGCDDSELQIPVEEPTMEVFSVIRINIRPKAYAITAIDAVSITGVKANGCNGDTTNGWWAPPHCTSCLFPYKGDQCKDLQCPGGFDCFNGQCDGDACECEPGFFGADCKTKCKSSQPWVQGTDPALLDLSLLCSGHGTCDDGNGGDGSCTCEDTYGKADCSAKCPTNPTTGKVCSDQGTCSDTSEGTGKCVCSGDFYGDDCSLTLCNGFECYNGNCTNNKCVCFRDSVNGFWAGTKCNKCDPKYTGSQCNERAVTQKVIRESVSSGYMTNLQLVALPDTTAKVQVDFGGDEGISLEVQIGTGVAPGGCTAFVDSGSPSTSCDVAVSELINPQVLEVKVADVSHTVGGGAHGGSGFYDGGSLTQTPFTATVTYDPACTETCEPHGFCEYIPPAVEEFDFDTDFGSGSFAGVTRKLLAIPTSLVLASSSASRTEITLEVQLDVANGLVGAVALPSGETPTSIDPAWTEAGDLYYGNAGTNNPNTTTSGSGVDAGDSIFVYINNAKPGTTYDVFFEGGDDYENFAAYSGPHTITTEGHPTVSVDAHALFGTQIEIEVTVSDYATVCVCTVPSGDGNGNCKTETSVCSDEDTTNTEFFIESLAPDTAYDLFYRVETWDAGFSNFLPLASYSTANFPEGPMSVTLTSSTEAVVEFTPNNNGKIHAVLLTVDDAVPDPATIKTSPYHTGDLTADEDVTITLSSLTASTNYKFMIVTESTSNQLSPVFVPLYFSTIGPLTVTTNATHIKGSSARIEVAPSLGGTYVVAIRYSENDAVTDFTSCDAAAPTLFCVEGEVPVTDSDEPTHDVDITGLDPATSYIAYVGVADALGTNKNDTSIFFTTTLQGVTSCNFPDYSESPTCTADAFFNEDSNECECFSGFTCLTNGQCVSDEEAAFLKATKGQCRCDANSIDGFWAGKSCSVCNGSYFGSDCTLTCYGTATLNSDKTACDCPAGTKFEGIECADCPAYLGFYGTLCNEQSPVVGVTTSMSMQQDNKIIQGMYQALEFSPLTITIKISDSLNTLSAFSAIQLDTYANYNENIHFPEASTTDDTCNTGTYTVPREPSVSTVECHLLDTWSTTSKRAVCSTTIPGGANFFSVTLSTHSNQVEFDLTIDVASGCCNGHGLCGEYDDECTCAMDSKNGFWNNRDECTTCFPGYSGSLCNVVTDGLSSASTGTVDIARGYSNYYSLRVEPNMPWSVAVSATADCDLTVKAQPQCDDGWYYHSGKCYKVIADECMSVVNAEQSCRTHGGTLAEMASIEDLEFMSLLLEEADVLAGRHVSNFCSRSIAIGLKRMKPICTPGNKRAPKNESECNKCADEGCSWTLKQCLYTGGISDCQIGHDQHSCEWDGSTRRRCQWISAVDLNGWNDVSKCVPAWNVPEWEDFNDALSSSISSEHTILGVTNCSKYTHRHGCNSEYLCAWDEYAYPPACTLDNGLFHQKYGGGPPDITEYDENYFKSFPTCGALFPSPDGERALLHEVPCTDKDRANIKPDPKNPMSYFASPFTGYICQRADTSAVSDISKVGIIKTVSADSGLVANPDCEMLTSKATETCAGTAGNSKNLLVARVTCLAAAEVEVEIKYVKKRRTEKENPHSVNCANSVAAGSWAGGICTQCAPRYSGDSCKQFDNCNDANTKEPCSSHGSCNAVTGYCDCQLNYYGMVCDTFCDTSTCGTGSCAAGVFETCSNNDPTTNQSRPCSWDAVCTCPGNVAGDACETCIDGFWGVDDCTDACDCNGQPCAATDGTCECYDDDRLGHFTGETCDTCMEDYYGVKCTEYCTPEETCNGNGECTQLGTCKCDDDFYGSSCQTKCTAAWKCNDHGTCTSSGSCQCHSSFSTGFWKGTKCDECASGYYGAKCSLECQCNAKGTCDKDTGKCKCHESDELGHFGGDHCDVCISGWVGEDCKTPENAQSNLFGTEGRYLVDPTARLLKDATMRGASTMFTHEGVRHLYAAAGTQIALFKGSPWSFAGACDLKSLLGYGTRFAASFLHGEFATFLLQDTERSYFITMSTTTPPMNKTHCKFDTDDATPLWDTPSLGNTATAFPLTVYDAVYDVHTSLAYVIFSRSADAGRTLNAIGVIDASTKAKLAQGIVETLEMESFTSLSAIAIEQSETFPSIYVAGTDTQSSVMLAKLFAPTDASRIVRLALQFQPHLCRRAVCTGVPVMEFYSEKLVTAIDTSDKGVILATFSLDGSDLKDFKNHFSSVAVLPGSSGCGFIAFDSYAETLLIGVGQSASPSIIKKFGFPNLEVFPSSLTLQYGQSSTDIEVVAAASIDVANRELHVVNKMTRMNILTAVLYDVAEVSPVVADSGGGTQITVTGSGFKKLNADIICKFGEKFNRQLKAKFISDTEIICQAPFVSSYDPCESIPLEVTFSDTTKFTHNGIQITHVNRPNVGGLEGSERGPLVATQPVRIVGTGFLNTPYLLCKFDGTDVPATYISTTKVTCTPPARTDAVRTVVEVSLDGQKFSSNRLPYYFIGLPTKMTAAWVGLTETVYTVNADLKVKLRSLRLVFFDAAGTDIADADELLRNVTVTLSLLKTVTSPAGTEFGELEGNLTQPIVKGISTFNDLFLEKPGTGEYTVVISTNYSDVPDISIVFNVKAVAHNLVFDGIFSNFTTSKRELDAQPAVKLVDIVGNTVTEYDTELTVEATISDPQPLCFGETSPDCIRIKNNKATLIQGKATFKDLWFKGNISENYIISFQVNINGIPELRSEPLYAADCPASNQLMSELIPNWITLSVGGTVRIKGWDFRAKNSDLYLLIDGLKFPARYIDTCTAEAVIPPTTVNSTSRRFDTQASSLSAKTSQITLVDGFSGQTSTPATFVVKNDQATQLSFSTSLWERVKSAVTLAASTKKDILSAADIPTLGAINVSDIEDLATCKSATSTYCYTTSDRVYLHPIPIVQVDEAGGEIYDGNGWDSTKNNDVEVQLVISAVDATSNTPQLEGDGVLGFSNTTLTTKNGILWVTGLSFVAPKAGDYKLVFTTGVNGAASTLTDAELTLTIQRGDIASIEVVALNEVMEEPLSTSYGGPLIERGQNANLDITVIFKDRAGNHLLMSDLSFTDVFLTATIQPVEIIKPPPQDPATTPWENITLPNDVNATSYGGKSDSSKATVEPSTQSYKLNDKFDFAAATISDLWFGVNYILVLKFSEPSLSVYDTTFVVRRANCEDRTHYGVNFTSGCSVVPEGGEVRADNHSMYLFTKFGYWRPDFKHNSFYACDLDTNCPGGYYSPCFPGTEGPTCAVCSDGFGKEGKECKKCPNERNNIVIVAIFILGMIVVSVIMASANLDVAVKPKGIFSIIIKILTNHLQTTSLMVDFMEKVDGIVKDLMDAQDRLAPTTSFVSFSCITSWTMYEYFLTWMLLPVAVIIVCFFVMAVVYIKQKLSYKISLLRAQSALEDAKENGSDCVYEELHLEALRTMTIPKELDEFDSSNTEYISPPLSDADVEDAYEEDRAYSSDVGIIEHKKAKVLVSVGEKLAEEVKYANRVVNSENADADLVKDCQDFLDAVASGSHDDLPVPSMFHQYQSRTTGLPFWVHNETGTGTWLRPTFMRYRGERAAAYFTGLYDDKNGDEDVEKLTGVDILNSTMHQKQKALDNIKSMTVDTAPAEDMARCSVCQANYALYTCRSCSDCGKHVPYCETCWYVIHAKGTAKADHVHVIYKTDDEIQAILKNEALDSDDDDELTEDQQKKKAIVNDIISLKKRHRPTTIFAVSNLVVIFLLYPHLMTTISQMMKCREISALEGSELQVQRLLEVDLRVDCNSSKYDTYRLAAIVCFFLYGVGFPLAGSLLMFSKRHTLLHRDSLATYGFLYSGYHLHAFYWEFVIMIRKMLVVFIIVFYEGHRNYRIMFGMWLITFFLVLNIFWRPYQLSMYWYLENCSLAAVVVTLNLSLLYQPQFALPNTGDNAVTIVIFLVNLFVLLLFLYYMLSGLRMDFIKAFDTDGSGSVSFAEVVDGVKRRWAIAKARRARKKERELAKKKRQAEGLSEVQEMPQKRVVQTKLLKAPSSGFSNALQPTENDEQPLANEDLERELPSSSNNTDGLASPPQPTEPDALKSPEGSDHLPGTPQSELVGGEPNDEVEAFVKANDDDLIVDGSDQLPGTPQAESLASPSNEASDVQQDVRPEQPPSPPVVTSVSDTVEQPEEEQQQQPAPQEDVNNSNTSPDPDLAPTDTRNVDDVTSVEVIPSTDVDNAPQTEEVVEEVEKQPPQEEIEEKAPQDSEQE